MKAYLFLLTSIFLATHALAEDNPAIEAMQEYMEFAEYSEGSISTEQLASIDSGEVFESGVNLVE